MTDWLTQNLLGEDGGKLAIAFGFGCAMGYGFAIKTSLAEARTRIAKLESEVAAIRDKYEKRLEREAA